jgi:hypothetical protein
MRRPEATLTVRLGRGLTSASMIMLLFLAALVIPSARPVSSLGTSCKGVSARPGRNLQAMINARGAGATFCLKPGTYRIPIPLIPKARQRFVASQRRRAILTGNGVTGSFAFNGQGVAGVEIRGLVVRDFVPPDLGGYAAIKAGPGWRVIDNQIGPNRNTGLYHEARSVVRGNLIKWNSLSGIGGFKAHRSLVVNNVLVRNGNSRVSGKATAAKWLGSIGLVVRGNYFHHNWNNSLWLDGDNLDSLVEDNIVADNFGKGIHYEISCAGVIRRNVVKRNTGPGILVVASRNVDVSRNIVTGNGDGIHVSHQDRTSENGANDKCRWVTGRVRIHHNKIKMTRGTTGLWTFQASDGNAIFRDGRVRFSANSYLVARRVRRPFLWANGDRTWPGWRLYGQDRDGTFKRF